MKLKILLKKVFGIYRFLKLEILLEKVFMRGNGLARIKKIFSRKVPRAFPLSKIQKIFYKKLLHLRLTFKKNYYIIFI